MSKAATNAPTIIWSPLAGTSQELAISSPANETLYCGTRGCGKTDVQIFTFAQNVGQGYGEYYRGIIFDRRYKNLDDIVARTKRWFRKLYGDAAKWYSNKADYKWVFLQGEELLIRRMENLDDYDDYHGQEYPFIGWNELTKYPNKDCYEAMMSCNRTSFVPEVDGILDQYGHPICGQLPLQIFSTTNPYGAGRGWVKRRFIDGYRYGEIQRATQMIHSARLDKMVEYTSTRVAVFGHYKENKKLPDQYIATLGNITNKNKRAAWLEGRWDVASGGVFEEWWDEDIHVLDNFTVPRGWELFPTMDWGSSAPFYVGWWAVSNGEDAYIKNMNGGFDIYSFPAGTLILVDEWYGSDGDGRGIQLGATKIAEGMKEREQMMRDNWYVYPDAEFDTGDADGQIFNQINNDDPTIADWFENEGVDWNRADKSAGSRKNGLALMLERLMSAVRADGRPAFYVMRRCKDFVDLVPTLPADPDDPDDVDTDAEDHAYDATRYAVLRVSGTIVTNLKNMRGGA